MATKETFCENILWKHFVWFYVIRRLSLLSNDPDPELLYPYAFHRSDHNLFWHQNQSKKIHEYNYMIRVCPIFECVSEFLSPITVLSCLVLSTLVVLSLSCYYLVMFVRLFIHCLFAFDFPVLLICWSVDLLLFLSRFFVPFFVTFSVVFSSRFKVMVWLCWYSCCCCCRQLFKKRFVDFSLYSSWGLHFLLLFHCIVCHCLSLFVNTFAPVFFFVYILSRLFFCHVLFPVFRNTIGHFRITWCLFFKASLGAHLWYANQFSFTRKLIHFHVKENWFAYERDEHLDRRFEKEGLR